VAADAKAFNRAALSSSPGNLPIAHGSAGARTMREAKIPRLRYNRFR